MNDKHNILTPRKRLEIALSHKEPDRIPFDMGSTKITGISMAAYNNFLQYKGLTAFDPKPEIADVVQQLARVNENVLQLLKIDTRGFIPAAPAAFIPESTEDESYMSFTDEWGLSWKKPKNGGYYYDLVSNPLTGDIAVSDLEKYQWPDPKDVSRIAGFEEQISNLNGQYGLVMHGICAGVLEMALRLRGFEDVFVGFSLEPELVSNLLNRIAEIKMAFWDMALDKVGKDILVAVEADDLGTQSSLLISPEAYRKFLKPVHTRLFTFIKKKAPHVKVFLHCCGAIRPIIPDLIESGVDILNPIQVSADGMDTKMLKKDFGDVLTFWGGGIDTQQILPHGTVEQVKDEVKRRIEDLAPGGGFVFNTVHDIQADVPPQNIEAMLDSLQQYGRY